MSKEIKYEPYFYLNGVGIHHKAWSKETKTMYFFTEDMRLQATISDCERHYDWVKCAKLFGDKK